MNIAKVKTIREALKSILTNNEELKNLNVDVTVGKISYSQTCATVKIEVADIAKDGTVLTKEQELFKSYASLYGLKPTDLNKTFTCNGKKFQITGCAPRSPKRPILAKLVGTNDTYKFTPKGVKELLDKS